MSGRALVLACLLISAVASPALGQGNRRTVLTLTGLPLSVTSTSPNDFDAGSVAIGSNNFSVDLTTNSGGGGFSPRQTAVNVRCAAGCPASVTNLQWRRSDLGTWNTLTTTFALIETRTASFNGANDPWSNTVFWRHNLAWTANPPAAAVTFFLEFQLVVTAP